MARNQIHLTNNTGLYFVTPTVWNWYYIFDRHNRWDILAESLIYLQKNKGLELHAYVFMLNHLHLIYQAPDAIGIIRDFKSHTAKEIRKNLEMTEPALLNLFRNDNGSFKLWKPDNQPKLIEKDDFYWQKLNYIHNNPVFKSYVEQPEHWKWSSANPNNVLKTVATL